MGVILAIALAVAGGDLAVTTAPTRPRVGHRVYVYLTGQVVTTGRLYVYRNVRRACATAAAGERRIGMKMADKPINGTFDDTIVYTPRRARREWICSYLYVRSCDAAGQNCGIAVGLPPEAGFYQNVVRVRPASQPVKSAAVSGRVIT